MRRVYGSSRSPLQVSTSNTSERGGAESGISLSPSFVYLVSFSHPSKRFKLPAIDLSSTTRTLSRRVQLFPLLPSSPISLISFIS
jgi:hypothetical protein